MRPAQRWGYGAGDFGINLFFMSAMSYLMFFYTDVFGLTAAAASLLFLVARFIDAITDPLMGYLVDRTRSRWGRMRPYLLFGAPPMALLLVLTFTVPPFGDTGKLIWAYVTYILFGIAYTVVGLPYASLTARLTQDYDERTRLSTIRMGCAFSGGLLVSVATLPLVNLAADPASGFFNTMLGFAVLATLLLWVAFASTEEPAEATASAAALSAPGLATLRQQARCVTQNPHLWVVIGIFCCGMLGFTVRSAATPYYFKYVVERPDLIPWFFGVTLSTMLAGLLAVPRLVDLLDKSRALYVGALVTFIGCLGLYFTAPESINAIFVWGCVIALGATPVAVLGWALLPDTVEYAQWRHGERADGVIYATASFMQKVAKMAGGAGIGALLAMTGYVANVDQSQGSIDGIVALMTWVPMLILVPLVVCAALYRLDEAAHRDIVAQLQASPEPGG